jgi:hypothetical protein
MQLDPYSFNEEALIDTLQVDKGTDSSTAWEWIKQLDGKGDGRLAMIKLHNHYNGPDKKRAQISLSEATIEGTYYKNEKALSFENFITKLAGSVQVLEQHGEPYADAKKLRVLLSKINSNDPDIIAGIAATCI